MAGAGSHCHSHRDLARRHDAHRQDLPPHQFSTAGALYGLAGVAFSIVSWLIVLCIVILVAAAIGAVSGERWFTPQRTGDAAR